MKLRRILCPTDFSEFSRRAFEQAVALARQTQAELTLLHVYPFLVPLGGDAPYFPSGLPLDPATRARLLGELEAAAAPARVAGLTPSLLLVEGDPSEEILRQARTIEADLIVTGTHGRRGFDRLVLGSVANRIVHHARCAVLTVPRPPEGDASSAMLPEQILCPVDLWESEAIVEAAFTVGRAGNARVTLLHVLEDRPEHEAAARLAHVDWAAFHEDLEASTRRQLKELAARQPTDGCRVSEVVVTGKPYREILKVAETLGANLIVMGIHGRNALERLFVGSTTTHVLRQAACPVLTVRPPSAKRS
jgi:nucleotide-binding universal stress UspA family protein